MPFTNGNISIKTIFKVKEKNNFTLVKNISVIQSLSAVGVLWVGVSWRFNFISRSDHKIQENISEIREKYLRIDKSVDRSIPDSDILENLSKSGENSVLSYCGGRYLFERIDQS